MKFNWIVWLLICSHLVYGNRHISEKDLWRHVVVVDRLAWQEREGLKKVNDLCDDKTFVRRIYTDITGKIPTYDQTVSFLKDKNVNKRSNLIEELLDTPGYASNFSNMWGDLLRILYSENRFLGNGHNDYKKYVERLLYENKPYDKMVYDLIMAEGTALENPAVYFYMRDRQTDVMDTTNATVRAFLGTRIGCAQCHNHRFDKWTQKEFYETAAFLWGTTAGDAHTASPAVVLGAHFKAIKEEKMIEGPITGSMRFAAFPIGVHVKFNERKKLSFPENYVYSNAKPNEQVQERIVFNYGDQEMKGKDRREVFANWLTSKHNPMFSKVMANRLWKRIMGVAIMEPVDDWKDQLEIQNPDLFNGLGEIFSELDYDFKAFLSVVFNSEAYQMSVDEKNEVNDKNYRTQGAALKRMSAPQIRDSLLTLRYGDLDAYSKLDSLYFEFQDRVRKVAQKGYEELLPMAWKHSRKYGLAERTKILDQAIKEKMVNLMNEVKELEAEYGFSTKSIDKDQIAMVSDKKSSGEKMKSEGSNKQDNGSMSHANKAKFNRSNVISNVGFLEVFGATDRSSPQTDASTEATMKQILKMINSPESRGALAKDSVLMKGLYEREKFGERISYLYYSIYSRAPSKKEAVIAQKYLGKSPEHNQWVNYTLALINSPEFYFVQ